MKKNIKNYNIGLDIGTNSVGWAVTDEENNIVKFNSKRHMWGVRLFDDAKHAAERRQFRSNARRLERRKERLRLLQDLLKEDVDKVSPKFFNNLKLSKYWNGDSFFDKKLNKELIRDNKYNLFNDESFNDKDFYKDNKTIYHLRNKLVNSKEKADIRLVYLAMHHIIKHRGNFLYQGEFKVANEEKFKKDFCDVIDYFIGENIIIQEDEILDEIIKIMKKENSYKKQKKEQILELFDLNKSNKKQLDNVINLILGGKVDLAKIFNILEKKSICLTDDYKIEEIGELLGDEIEVFSLLESLNSWYTFQNILKGKEYISEAFIEKYDKYREDLRKLKAIYREKIPDKYNKMFKGKNKIDKIKTYYGYNKQNNKCSINDLYDTIKKDLKNVEDCDLKDEILKDIADNNFLVKLKVSDNGAIPHQIHRIELKCILENQAKYYPSIEKNKDKIIDVFNFRIPYYVGPLHNEEGQPNNWSIRKEDMEHVKVLPWNFGDIIDSNKTAEEFIRRMTNKCTYLPEEDVMPKNSLLYSEYCVLNELNNIRVGENKRYISKELKEKIINDLFKKYKKITKKKLITFLNKESLNNIIDITGFQKDAEFASSLTSYIDFCKILNHDIRDDEYEMVEELIYWITIFEDKDILKEKVKKKYGNYLTKEQIKKVIDKKYTGWSNLSKKLLVDLKYENECRVKLSIMDILRTTNYNFMQIITNKDFGFYKIIEENKIKIENKKINYNFYKDNISNLMCSPALKRGIWQTLKIINEIIKVTGNEPKNIFIEVAKSDEEKKRTKTRRNKLEKNYKEFCKKNKDDINKEISNKLKDTKLNITDRLYLYLTQNGKCMYSGMSLDIDQLDKYEVDHIIPQCKIKDDSLDNKVLVRREDNQRKLDGFLSDYVVNKRKYEWKKLFECKLISPKKYYSLLNNKDSEKRDEGFIRRQIVETRQITKHVINILQNLYDDTKIYAIKANLGHNFREKYDVIKIRELNDYHHIHDAYINSVIGNYIIKKYPKLLKEFEYSEYIKYIKWDKNKDEQNKNRYGFIINGLGKEYTDKLTGEIIDEEKAVKEIKRILNNFKIKDAFITRKLEEKTGDFHKQTILSKEKAAKKSKELWLKQNLEPNKYGSYDEIKTAYCTLVKIKNKIKAINIPVRVAKLIKENKLSLLDYLKKNYGDVCVLKDKVLKNQLIYKEGKTCYIVSAGEYKFAKQLFLEYNDQLLLYFVLSNKHLKKSYMNKVFNILENKKVEEYNINYSNKEYSKNNDIIDELKEEVSIYLYTLLVNKVIKQYSEFSGNKFVKYKEEFIKSKLEDKIKAIKDLLPIFKGTRVNLKSIGLTSDVGRQANQWIKNSILVNQSVTGIYEKRVDINELANSNNIS